MSTELDHLRAFRAADGEPDEAARMAARVALLERIDGAPHGVPAVRRPRRRLLAGALGLAATALAAVALVAGLGSGGVQPATAAEALRQAAAVAERQPDPPLRPDQYWYTRYEGEQGEARWVREDWVSPTGATRWVVHRPGQPDEVHEAGGRSSYSFFPRQLTRKELLALPTDADALYERMREAGEVWSRQTGNRLGPEHAVLTIVGDWLTDATPPPAALRAALFRVAARLPGIELIGEVRDARGRSGTSVALTDAGQRRELVFDADKAELLEERTVRASDGQVLYRATYVASGAVDAIDEIPKP